MSGYRWILAGGSVVILGMAAWLYAAVGAKSPHLTGTACSTCHLGGKEVDPMQASKLVAAQENLCGACHPKAVRASHPSGMAPRSKPPAEYPLDWKGDLTCSTCHLPHGTQRGLLRGARRGRELCFSCHDVAFFRGMKDEGASMELSGHLNAGVELRNIDLDPYSLQCLHCHETKAESSGVRVDLRGIMRHASGSANHPIGRSYGAAVRFGGYRPEIMLSKKIFLPDGKISCVSCHQGYSKDHGKLVIARNLCAECHNL